MLQALLPTITIGENDKNELDKKIDEIYHLHLRKRFKDFGKLEEVILNSSSYTSSDLKYEQEPEEFAKRYVIEPLIEFLGYEIISKTVVAVPGGKNKPDYTLKPKGKERPILFYVEAEPLNTNLYGKKHGVRQVEKWLLSRASETNYGIATDGFKWILLKFDETSAKSVSILEVDLRELFIKKMRTQTFFEKEYLKKIMESFLILHSKNISSIIENYLIKIEEEKEEISKKFYHDYVRYVFGYDERGEEVLGLSLLKSIKPPQGDGNFSKEPFAVLFMNRIIFIKFLEEKKIVPGNLLEKLLEEYRKLNPPSTFYDAYLKPLFYDVFNKSKDDRSSTVKGNNLLNELPYLNGSLFREVIEKEKDYTIENEGVELVIKNLLGKYTFGLKSDSRINPDILGYVFEKTINYISGVGTNQQKMKGAYYTPDDVVKFIIEKTLVPVIFEKMIEGLKRAGWTDTDLKGYNSIEDMLNPENMPKNPIHVKEMINSIDTIKVLDPACGSGHFLTAILAEILRVKQHLLNVIGEDVDRYQLKKDIISKNIFGVDIDNNAVEIAMLRLWLSIVEEIESSEHIDTLPNIEFNILSGNSLVGWLKEDLKWGALTPLLDDEYIKETLNRLSTQYEKEIEEIKLLLQKVDVKSIVEAYKKLIGIYLYESGRRAAEIKTILEKIRNRVYEPINNAFLAFIEQNSDLNKKKIKEIRDNIKDVFLHHWMVDFWDVLTDKDGGFDIIVGNPPYIEDRNYKKIDLYIIKSSKVISKRVKGRRRKKLVGPFFYQSKDCGNTHAYFIERSIALLKKNGRFGFIVPISLVSTDRMDSIREYIHSNSSQVYYYNFDDRPGKIFSGLEDCRSTIVITAKGGGVTEVITSKYHRWYTRDRPSLFENLKTTSWNIKDSTEIIPKIGTKTEQDIMYSLNRRSNGKTLGSFIINDGAKIWYHNSPRYWIHAHTDEYLPKVKYYDDYEVDNQGNITPKNFREEKPSDQYKFIALRKKHVPLALALLNSSLFYWWFVIWSDGRHLLDQHIRNFPIDLDKFSKEKIDRLSELGQKLMENYEKTSRKKINRRRGGYAIVIKEIIPSRSKDIIDEIDEVLAEYYSFDKEESDFIKDFDIDFRLPN